MNEHASCAADWRLFCPESWDDKALDDPVQAARAAGRRARAGIPGDVRHQEKWRLALEMIDEMTGPGGWGVLDQVTAAGGARPAVTADAGYGDSTAFRLELEQRGWQYAVAVKGTTSAYAGDAEPVTRVLGGGPGRPPRPAYPRPPASLRTLALASADQIRPGHLAAGHQGRQRQPRRLDDQPLPGDPGPPRQPGHPPRRLTAASRTAGCWPNGPPKRTSPRTTGCRTCPQAPPSRNSSAWPRSAGGSSTTTASSRPASAWTTSRAAPTGWHRHVTLAALAQAFITMIRTDPKAPAPG